MPKSEIFAENINYKTFNLYFRYWLKIESLVKYLNFRQKSKYLPKSENFGQKYKLKVRNKNFGQTLRVWSEMVVFQEKIANE